LGKGTKLAAVGGIIAVVASIVGILGFVYPIVEEEVFPEKNRYEVTATLKGYDFLTDEVIPVQNLELVAGYDIDSIAEGIENQIISKIKPEVEEVTAKLEISGNILISSIPLDTTTFVYQGVIQSAPIMPMLDEPILENTQEIQFDLSIIYQEPFIDPNINCVKMSIQPSGSYSKKTLEICKDISSNFQIDGENSQEFTFSPTGRSTIIIESFKAEGEGHQDFPTSLLQSKIETKLSKYSFIDIEQRSLEELREKRDQVTTLSPSEGKIEIAEIYDVDFILSGTLLVEKER